MNTFEVASRAAFLSPQIWISDERSPVKEPETDDPPITEPPPHEDEPDPEAPPTEEKL